MRYAKAGIALVAIVASYLAAHFSGGTLNPTEWSNVVIAGLTAGGVFTAANVPQAPVTKSAIATLGAVFMGVNNVITPGTSMPEWWQLAVAATGALGVYFVRNKAGT